MAKSYSLHTLLVNTFQNFLVIRISRARGVKQGALVGASHTTSYCRSMLIRYTLATEIGRDTKDSTICSG